MILVLTGPVHGGKTTFLRRSLARWTARGLSSGGFLSVAAAEANGARGYDLLEVRTGRRHPYLRLEGAPGAERTGPFFFVPGTLDLARALIRDAGPAELLVVDEVGPLELRGGGLWPALGRTLARPGQKALLVVREEILADVVAALAPVVPTVFDVRDPGAPGSLDERVFGAAVHDDGPS
jgi:nucleoside-triphosphatase THEP1